MIDKIIEQQEIIKGMQENEESAIKIMKMYEDYKLRVDRAIEYINNWLEGINNEDIIIAMNILENILKGE